ncbi:hypothetical protein M409DRAFT_28044 [Zasmidium cellare ATCC 36951]|uniref:Glycoside hydrolase family 105 protein n=1 Tax=Zasmidium cellare ATCC 36951 TaxID=1080233 RepID=A0A6A6C7D7_ZASCE|nr:uncharacterized protein M409DRAFT_28044 [Zasmidium cellare ATCC 36951]KAF2161649.1 hypothetical protein M409DRAFT_28044 [Zasmidium cellare ATCC 36951]
MASSLLSFSLYLFISFAHAQRPASYSNNPPPHYSHPSCCDKHNIGYNPILAANQAKRLSTHSWEYGTTAEALLELYNPHLSVFSRTAFPNNHLPIPDPDTIESLRYARQHIRLNSPTLIDGGGATGDPASLGVSALLIGQSIPAYNASATRQLEYLLNPLTTPRLPNGAFSHREAYPAAWADFISMAPPFMAYYAVATQNDSYIRAAIGQCLFYRQILKPNDTESDAWQHILFGPRAQQDPGRWSTGNGWAAMGMARVLGTLVHWLVLAKLDDEKPRIAAGDLFLWIGEIVSAAMGQGVRGQNGLLRNYWDQEGWEGEISGTALVSAAVYRAAVLQREAAVVFDGVRVEGSNYTRPITPAMLSWADQNRKVLAGHVNELGIGSPAVNPLDWKSRAYVDDGSPEGQAFLVMLYAAWRDCVVASVCRE